jgi:plasmid stabilization system protein ParE
MCARKVRAVLTLDARQDLSDILVYTEQQWGKRQRLAYNAMIQGAIRELIRFPLRGRAQDHLSVGLRNRSAGSHVIYDWVTDAEIVVAHILHSSRDAERLPWMRPITP